MAINFPKITSTSWIKLNCGLTALLALLSVIHVYNTFPGSERSTKPKIISYSGCCIFPCKNGGICSSDGTSYVCDCTNTDYYGQNCEQISWLGAIKQRYRFKENDDYFTGGKFAFLWNIINGIGLLKYQYNKMLYFAKENLGDANFRWKINTDYLTADAYQDTSTVSRILPPIPRHCPTPMGFAGPYRLPSVVKLYKRILRRVRFKPCSQGTNLLFGAYIQHFISQFSLKNWLYSSPTDWLDNTLDMSHVYGKDHDARLSLRSFGKGKLKSRIIDNEEYPPYLTDCPSILRHIDRAAFAEKTKIAYVKPEWAIANPALGLDPFLFAISTIWLREHNRICDVLANEHEQWSDEQIYQTARLILTGEAIKITLTEFVQHFMGYRLKILYDPTITHNLNIQYLGRVPQEIFFLPLWQTFMPNVINVDKDNYMMSNLTFSNSKIVMELGLQKIVSAMIRQPAGEMIYNNIGEAMELNIKETIREARKIRTQSYNNYRKKFNLKPVQSFEELTGDLYMASVLKELYVDVDAVELIIGLLVEDKPAEAVIPRTMATIGGSWLINALISHPINSREWWKPSTFGGEVGMEIVKSATLQRLFCHNMADECVDMRLNFKVPYNVDYYL